MMFIISKTRYFTMITLRMSENTCHIYIFDVNCFIFAFKSSKTFFLYLMECMFLSVIFPDFFFSFMKNSSL